MLLIYGTYDQVLLVITEGVSAVAASSFSRLVVVGDHRNRKLKLLCRTSRPMEKVLAAHNPRVRQVNGMMKSSGCFRAKRSSCCTFEGKGGGGPLSDVFSESTSVVTCLFLL